jgi:hypothetical protein
MEKSFIIDGTGYNRRNPLVIAELGTGHGADGG